MSINLHLYAEREVYSKQGKYLGIQREKFDLWQTPTKDTYKIIESSDVLESYKQWLVSWCNLDTEGVYINSDKVETYLKELDGQPYDYYVYTHYGLIHFKDLLDWKEEKESVGFTLKFEIW